MKKTLDVWLHGQLAGHLTQDAGGGMEFSYAASWLSDARAVPLSHSLPLRAARFARDECAGFFAGILPEEEIRRQVARNLGVSADNDFALLERIGGECAGAVTFMPHRRRPPQSQSRYRKLSADGLLKILQELPRRPLMAGERGIRLSLAGAQNKIPVSLWGGEIFLPANGAPSTHILKPAHPQFANLVDNELACLRLARRLGLPAVAAEKRRVGGIDFLLVERYDRKFRRRSATGLPREIGAERLHQEDFCQALNLAPAMKYQKEGGPSLAQCFALLRGVSPAPAVDLQNLLDAVIFNCLAGNNDAHGKNFSLLHDRGAPGRLAPLYDLVCTAYYPALDKKMAMKIGGENVFEKIKARHFEKFARETGLAGPLVKKRVVELAGRMLAELDALEFAPLGKLFETRCLKIVSRMKNGC